MSTATSWKKLSGDASPTVQPATGFCMSLLATASLSTTRGTLQYKSGEYVFGCSKIQLKVDSQKFIVYFVERLTSNNQMCNFSDIAGLDVSVFDFGIVIPFRKYIGLYLQISMVLKLWRMFRGSLKYRIFSCGK